GAGHRDPSGDYGGLFAGASSDSAWVVTAACDPAHVGVAGRPNLYPARHRRIAARRAAAGRPVPYIERARIRLWNRSRDHDGCRRPARLHRDLEILAMAVVAGGARHFPPLPPPPPLCLPPSFFFFSTL